MNSLLVYINNFEWVTGVTPFSSVWTPLIATFAYLVVIFSLQEFMKNRKEIHLHYICLAHNLFLSVLSLVMFLGILVPLFITEVPQGLYHIVCKPVTKGQIQFFYYIFYLSKVYEFLDTIFLVLRKKKLLFLHMLNECLIFNLHEHQKDVSVNVETWVSQYCSNRLYLWVTSSYAKFVG
ncbi:hypothetical protein PPL_02328 [Heterostelium album PN500]|uniref:Elongation of fatty acids protein n=1 Tax=Heterostelium pallidum (strain ATCC 26659 / Pp 5 / PN500) TaxID=670386 RepID=D3B203_HETP5|nr:hypothetical protein PPL_02328 [Heterostelium album PN500]EFA85327.1 hypothetical protein PPL_02328 [Heterostelium album PN500]|eukprot:XP_020437436.1 hypothetical protein PPL_02328 [Heterostelium album PN500]